MHNDFLNSFGACLRQQLHGPCAPLYSQTPDEHEALGGEEEGDEVEDEAEDDEYEKDWVEEEYGDDFDDSDRDSNSALNEE